MLARLRHHLPALGSILVRGLGVAAGFGVALLVGRNWGPEANGVYALVTQTAIFLATLVAGGMDLSVTRFFAATIGQGKRVAVQSFLRIVALTFGLVVVVVCTAWLGSDWLGVTDLFAPRGALALLSAMVVARALTRILGAALRAHGRYAFGQAIDGLFIPVIVLLALVSGLLADVGAALDLTAFAGGIAVACGFAASLAALRRGKDRLPAEIVPLRPMVVAAIPLWGLSLALSLTDWYGLATVAAQHGTHDAGLYRIAMQFASALSIVLMSLFSVFSPQVSAAHAIGDWPKVARLARSATRLGSALVVPPATILILAAPWILSFIGPEFAEASTMMRLAVFAQILGVMLGPPGLVLAMVGHERVVFAISVVCTGAMLVVTPIAALYLGATGVVLSLSAVTIARNVCEFTALRRLTGVNGLTGRFAPPARGA